MISTGIYVRVSTEEQAKEGYSIRAQMEKLKSYADIKDWHVFKVYSDEGISGKDIDGRPAIKEMISDVENGKINNVLVYKIDRLTRSTKNLIELVDLFNYHNCAFNSLTESIDTSSATGRMFLKIVGIFAEFERENLAERVKMGKERKVREGYSICSWTQSYGYKRELGQNVQIIIPEEAAIVRRIFNMYLYDDLSLNGIAKKLNAEKIPTKTKKSLWLGCTIKVLLKNPTYLGKVRYSMNDPKKYFEADGHHEAIIEESVFYQVQEKLERIKQFSRTKRAGSAVYFCGVLYCSHCGGRMTTKWNYNRRADGSKKEHANYKCTNAQYGICSTSTLSHKKVEQAFEKYIGKFEDISEPNCRPPEIQFNLFDNWIKLDNDQRQQFMQQFVKKILVHGEATKGYIRDKIVIDDLVFNEF